MTRHSEDSISLYSLPSLQKRTSTVSSSTVASPYSAEVVLGRMSINARRLSPLSTSYGNSGAWTLQNETDKRPLSPGKKRISNPRLVSSTTTFTPWAYQHQQQQEDAEKDAERLGEMFTSVNSGLHVTFPKTSVEGSQLQLQQHLEQQARTQHQPQHQQQHQQRLLKIQQSRPPRVQRISLSRTMLLSTEEEEDRLMSTPPRKKRADLQSKFSMSPDTRSATARNAKALKQRASQGRLRKISAVNKEQPKALPVLPEQIRPRLKPQSSLQGLKKICVSTGGV